MGDPKTAPRRHNSVREKTIESKKEKDMKKLFVFAVFFVAVCGVKAQDCDALMLPYFHNDVLRMSDYKAIAPEKFDWRCAYARSAFYESDTVPAGADVFQISEVKSIFSNEYLGQNYVVNLETLSYYAYNFIDFQRSYYRGNKVLCFATPSSAHPYLILNSLEETNRLASELWERERAQ